MLVKLAFAMQRFKKYLKIFCHDQQRRGGGGETIFRLYGRGQFLGFMGVGHRVHGGPPTWENPAHILHGHV